MHDHDLRPDVNIDLYDELFRPMGVSDIRSFFWCLADINISLYIAAKLALWHHRNRKVKR